MLFNVNNKIVRNSLVVASLFGAVSFSNQAAASDCKGLENSACGSNNACRWVEGYERKDGRKVKSFCRAKPNFKKKLAVQTKTSAIKKSAGK